MVTIDQKGKVKKKYPYEKINTPYEKLKSLPRVETYLRPDITLDKLDAIANQMSDNKFAERMGKARSNLFKQTNKSKSNSNEKSSLLISSLRCINPRGLYIAQDGENG